LSLQYYTNFAFICQEHIFPIQETIRLLSLLSQLPDKLRLDLPSDFLHTLTKGKQRCLRLMILRGELFLQRLDYIYRLTTLNENECCQLLESIVENLYI